LGLIPQPEIQGYVRTHLPFVAGKQPEVYRVRRKAWDARIHAELRSSAAQCSNLCGGITHVLKQESQAIPFDGLDRDQNRISASVDHRVVSCFQLRSEAAAKSERAVEVLTCVAAIHLS